MNIAGIVIIAMPYFAVINDLVMVIASVGNPKGFGR